MSGRGSGYVASGPLAIALFGAPGAHLNLGVGALRESAVTGLLARRPDVALTVFDDGWGVRNAEAQVGGETLTFALCGVRNSRRWHKRESYLNMRLSALLGGAGNPGLARVDGAHAVWDVSGGDSFSDLYGRARFETVTAPKELALRRGRPLLLLPQTYGPFADSRLRERARRVVARCTQAWARDADSYDRLCELLGTDHDPARHRSGVDLAFGLPPMSPPDVLRVPFERELASLPPGPLAGINVSGLLLNEEGATDKYRLVLDYSLLVRRLAERLLADGANLVLVPHVLGGPGAVDSDEDVTRLLHQELVAQHPGRVLVAPRGLGPGGRKWLIAQLKWFSGARMHATIAALSSGVPTAPLAYSLKFRGVFASCGLENQVVDARYTPTDEALERLIDSWHGRDAVRDRLRQGLPAVLERAQQQMDELVSTSSSLRAAQEGRT